MSRSLALEFDEQTDAWNGARGVGCRPGGSSYYDVYSLRVGSHAFPEYWRDTFRYELKKHPLAAETVTFEESKDCSAERYEELQFWLDKLPCQGQPEDQIDFLAITLQLEPRHSVAIFLLRNER